MDILKLNMEELMKQIGERIKELRKRKHWTQDELAHLLEVAPSSVGSYERGSRQPAIEIGNRSMAVDTNHILGTIPSFIFPTVFSIP